MKFIGIFIVFTLSAHAFAENKLAFGINNNGFTAYWAELVNESATPIQTFKATWTVPAAPSTYSLQGVYYWIGLEPLDHATVLQPILGWDSQPPGTPPQWSVFCMSVGPDGHPKVAQSVPVRTGDIVTGVVTLESHANGNFTYSCKFEDLPGTELSYKSASELKVALTALEAHSMTKCSDYPGEATFSNIAIQTQGVALTSAWNTRRYTDTDTCGERVHIVENTSVDGQVIITPVPK